MLLLCAPDDGGSGGSEEHAHARACMSGEVWTTGALLLRSAARSACVVVVGLPVKPSRRRRRATHRRPSCLAGFDPDGVSVLRSAQRGGGSTQRQRRSCHVTRYEIPLATDAAASSKLPSPPLFYSHPVRRITRRARIHSFLFPPHRTRSS